MSEFTLRPIAPIAIIILLGLIALGWCAWIGFNRRADAARWAIRGVMVLLITLMVLGPATTITRPQTVLAGVDVFFVVDRTGSMAAEDWNGSEPRLEGVKHDILAAMDQLPGMRYSIISFDSKSNRVLPLTSDVRAVRTWVTNLRQEITLHSSGSAIDRASQVLLDTVQGAAEQRPDNLRLVYFFSDGENTADPNANAPSFSAAAPFIGGGAVFGYGTAEGGHMRVHTGGEAPGADASFIVDPNTNAPAISRVDEVILEETAQQLGLDYAHRSTPDSLESIIGDVVFDLIEVDGGRRVVSYQTHLWILAVPLIGLLSIEAWRIGRRFGQGGQL